MSQWTLAPDDTDLGALKTVFDANHDGRLDAQGSSFADFRVWQDKSGDGVSDAGELQTLTEAGIQTVRFTSTKTDWINGEAANDNNWRVVA